MKIATFIEKLFNGEKKETTERGSQIIRAFYPSERYIIDFADFKSEGWEQFDTDQDAHYFGVWVNKTTLQTLTYAEGDWSLVTCDTKEQYNKEIESMIDFYDEGFIAIGIDPEKGESTKYVQDRSKFYIK